MKVKLIIFGTGKGAEKALMTMEDEKYEIVAFVDNNSEKKGTFLRNVKIISPEEISKQEYDKIVICSTAFQEIREQLLQLGISKQKLADRNFFHTQRFLEYYADSAYKENYEIQQILQYVSEYGLGVFNYSFTKTYQNMEIVPLFDEEQSMYYVIYRGKKMYLSKNFDTEKKVIDYCRWLALEQDKDSPHKYFDADFKLNQEAVVLDAGVAEGNFALDIIDTVSKIYLVETDHNWIEALKKTFEPYKEKVVLIHKFLTDYSDEEHITIDEILGENHIDFVKMDIEGSEESALRGAKKTLERNEEMMLDICAYHTEDAEKKIVELLKKSNFQTSHSKGYMVFDLPEYYTMPYTRKLVRGLIRGKRG